MEYSMEASGNPDVIQIDNRSMEWIFDLADPEFLGLLWNIPLKHLGTPMPFT